MFFMTPSASAIAAVLLTLTVSSAGASSIARLRRPCGTSCWIVPSPPLFGLPSIGLSSRSCSLPPRFLTPLQILLATLPSASFLASLVVSLAHPLPFRNVMSARSSLRAHTAPFWSAVNITVLIPLTLGRTLRALSRVLTTSFG